MSQSTRMQRSNAAAPRSGAKIASLAYALWVERGCPEGSPDVDWLEAEEELRGLEDQSSAGNRRRVLHPPTPKREEHNMLERYCLKADSIGVRRDTAGRQEVLPAGSHVLADVTRRRSGDRLINVVWNGENVIMFAMDIQARAELVPGERELIFR